MRWLTAGTLGLASLVYGSTSNALNTIYVALSHNAGCTEDEQDSCAAAQATVVGYDSTGYQWCSWPSTGSTVSTSCSSSTTIVEAYLGDAANPSDSCSGHPVGFNGTYSYCSVTQTGSCQSGCSGKVMEAIGYGN